MKAPRSGWRTAQWQERRPPLHLSANDDDPPFWRLFSWLARYAWLLTALAAGLVGFCLGRI